jgi:hypothetical protein
MVTKLYAKTADILVLLRQMENAFGVYGMNLMTLKNAIKTRKKPTHGSIGKDCKNN